VAIQYETPDKPENETGQPKNETSIIGGSTIQYETPWIFEEETLVQLSKSKLSNFKG
jgi:hypothetical protein